MTAADPGPGTTRTVGGTATPDTEAVLVSLERCALLRAPALRLDGEGGDPHHPALAFRAAHSLVRHVGSLGIQELLQDRLTPAEPARLLLTDRTLLVQGLLGGMWTAPLDGIAEVVHSNTEPVSVLRRAGSPDCAVLVPPVEADRWREALDRALVAAAAGSSADVATIRLEPPTLPDNAPAPAPETSVPGTAPGHPPPARLIRVAVGTGDRVFRSASRLAGLSVLAVMGLVGLFLLVRSLTALRASGWSFLTTSEWQPDTHHFGIAAVLTGTIVIALVALTIAVPLATGTALFISEIAPRRFKQWFVAAVDLMAAVPSVIYGLWGFKYLQGHVIGVSRWLSTWFSWIPLFEVKGSDPRNPLATASVYTASAFIAGMVVALMVIPITCSIMREVFSQAPAGEREGAYALGATRWGMIRSVVLPFAKGGMIGGIMLGLGRALGETIAVVLIISPLFDINWHILQTGTNSVASLIVLRQGDASGFGLSALMAAGLALFVLTLIVNFSAATIVARSRSGAESEA